MKLEQFKIALEKDCEKMEKIVLPLTVKGIKQLMQNYMEKNLRNHIKKRYNSFMELEEKKEVHLLIITAIRVQQFIAEVNGKNYCAMLKN